MQLYGIYSIWDEVEWGLDAPLYRSSLYKVEANYVIRGNIDGFDTDYYRLTIPYSGTFTVTISNHSTNNWGDGWTAGTVSAAITDDLGSVVSGLSTSAYGVGDGYLTFTWSGGYSTDYYLKLSGFSDASYVVQMTDVTSTPPPVADDYANNSSTTGAVAIGGQATGNIENPADQDWFKVSLVAGTTYLFDLRGTDGGGGTLGSGSAEARLSLYDNSGYFVQSSINGGTGGDPLMSYVPTVSGQYYLSVMDLYDAGTGTYTLRASTTENNLPEGNLVLTGDAVPGESLSVETQGISDEDGLGSFSYQWLRDGVDISGASSLSYTVKNADLNKSISVEVSYTDGGTNVESIISATRYPVAGNTPEYIDLMEMYVVIAGRAPDAGGLDFWSEILDSGKEFYFIAGEMWNASQTQALYPPSMSTEDKVTAIYSNVLNREPDQDGLDFWVGRWESIGPVDTMLEMIDAIKGYAGENQEGLVAKQLFMNKIDVGAYLAITHESDDLDLASDAYDYLGGHTLEETIEYVDNQLDAIGQSTLQTANDVFG